MKLLNSNHHRNSSLVFLARNQKLSFLGASKKTGIYRVGGSVGAQLIAPLPLNNVILTMSMDYHPP